MMRTTRLAENILLSREEVELVAGNLTQPRRQVERLRELGFWRARLNKRGNAVIVERAHYLAVCAGAVQAVQQLSDTMPRIRPRVRP